MTPRPDGHAYSYSAVKGEDGRFYGAVYFHGEDSTDTIATIDGIRTQRGVKGFAKSAAESHRRANKPVDGHASSHSVWGGLTV